MSRRLAKKSGFPSLIVRVYDVTDILFDGYNAHSFFDINIKEHAGSHYFTVEGSSRNYLAETGLLTGDGSFHSLARSGTLFMGRDKPSGNFEVSGLFAGGSINRTFTVSNIFAAPVFEQMNTIRAETERAEPLSVANVFLNITWDELLQSQLKSVIATISDTFEILGGESRFFSTQPQNVAALTAKSLIQKVNAATQTLYRRVSAAHKKKPFHIIHCHDWYSSKVGITASEKLNVPLVLSLYSTEHERSGGDASDRTSSQISSIEHKAVDSASLVIVPRESTRLDVLKQYKARPENVVIIPHVFGDMPSGEQSDSIDVRHWLGLDQNAAIVLFAGEISHAAGADIMVDALPAVCRNHSNAHFVFAGTGPLQEELESRVWHMGIGEKCRFPGDLKRESFQSLLMDSDFVVIPARTLQDEGLARLAISQGKPVLITQQSGIQCVTHGENGLITFDNPGSIVWGIQELLANPLGENMLRREAQKNIGKFLSYETIAARQFMYYEMILKGLTNA